MKKLLMPLLLLMSIIPLTMLFGCAETAVVESISITTLPKTEYEIGEELDLSGGVLTVTFSDSSSETVLLTDSSVIIQRPNMNTTGEKNVSVTYGSKSVIFKITISNPKLSVTFDPNYEGASLEVVLVDNGSTVSAPESTPVRDGFAFLGWYIGPTSESRFNFDLEITSDTIIYARWSASISVSFDLNYTDSANFTIVANEEETINRPENPTREGYIFTGWYTNLALTEKYDFSTAVTEELTLYAGWQEVQSGADIYTVAFNYNYPDGSEESIGVQVEEGNAVDEIMNPEFSGATFDGWYTDTTYNEAFNFSSSIEADMTIYAKWTVGEYIIKYYYNHENNDSLYLSEEVKVGRRTSEPDTPELSGFYFSGWYLEEECINPFDFNSQINDYHTLYAKWLKVNTFEAEYTYLTGKPASGYSSNGFGPEVLIKHISDNDVGASNDHWVSDLHYQNAYIEYVINSDTEVTDAVLVLRISADFFDITLSQENFGIEVNGTFLEYSAVVALTDAVSPDDNGLTTKRPFSNHVFITDLHLQEGQNIIRFVMLDNVRYGDTGTMYATAPMFDCIYINTNANLTWNPYEDNI